MSRDLIKYTLISMGVITLLLAGYYIYLLSKEKKSNSKSQQIQRLLQAKQQLLQAKSKVNSRLQEVSKK